MEVNEGQTTTFFLKTETAQGRRPLGLITSTKGTFVNEGTTTEYATQIIGTSIEGTYAKVQSTQSRVFSLVPTDSELPKELLPTGLVSSTVVTRIRGEVTTIETTQFVRTFIDDEYAQEVLTTSEIFAPLHIEDDESGRPINPSAVHQQVIPTVVIDSSLMSPDESGKIQFKTSHLTSIVGERVIEPSISSSTGSNSEEQEDDGKVITSFNEEVVSDNTLRESRAKKVDDDEAVTEKAEDSVAEVSPSKPNKPALETFVATPILSAVEDPAADTTEENLSILAEPTEEPSFDLTLEPEQEDVKPLEQPAVIFDDAPEETSLSPDGEADVADSTEAISSDQLSVVDEPAPVPDPNTIREGRVEPVGRVEPRPSIRKSSGRPTSARPTLNRPISTSATQVLQPTGLLSTFEGSLVSDGTTTVYTSSVFGTFIDGEYANVVSSTSTLILPSSTSAISPSTTTAVEVLATAVPESGAEELPEMELKPEPELESSLNQPTEAGEIMPSIPLGMLSVTRLTTFTFFTTFFMTKEDSVITSVVTREVISSEVQLVEETAMDSIKKQPAGDKEADSFTTSSSNETSTDGNSVVSTVYTTYTYFTTFFDDRTTKLLSREEVVSNLVTLTDGQQLTPTSVLARDGDHQETTATPDVSAGGDRIQPSVIESSLAETGSSDGVTGGIKKQLFNSLANGIIKTFFTTFTFFTTALVNGTTVVSSRIMISSNAVTPTVELTDIDEDLWESLKAQDDKSRSLSTSSVSLATTTLTPTAPLPVAETAEVVPTIVVESTSNVTTQSPDTSEIVVDATSPAPEASSSLPAAEEETPSSTDISPTPPAATTESIASSPDPVSEIPTEAPEIDPSTTSDDLALPNTFYTTFTYFTTFFTEGTSNIVSREETITNVMTDAESMAEATMMTPVLPVFPITYYTTYTYRTTSFVDGETIVSTREETISNVVTPTAAAGEASVEAIEPTAVDSAIEVTPTPSIDPGLITHYTTFTYFTTTFEADTAIVSSSLETITNIVPVEPTELSTPNGARNIGNNQDIGQLLGDISDDGGKFVNQPTGLLTTMRSTQVNNGITTLFTTDVLGTFINGQYARILESSSEVLTAGSPRLPTVIVAATGVEDVEATDLFPNNNNAELEGSIQQTDSDEDGKGRVTTRLSGPLRSRTFTPSIRPFTQRVRPPLSVSKKPRPPFTSGAAGSSSNDGDNVVASSAFPVSAAGGSLSSTNRFSSSRFRPSSITSSGTGISPSNTVDGSSRSQFFRLRGSSLSAGSSINPTPVVPASTSRTFSSSIRSSLGGPRRPSTLQASSLRPALSTSRFSRPTTASSIEEEESSTGTTEETVEAVTTPPRPSFSPRRPSPSRLNAASDSASSSASTPAAVSPPSRRNFPFSRGSPRPQVAEKAPVETSTRPVESNSDSETPSTSRPRFVRPPKVTFTEKPRPIIRLPTRPGSRRVVESQQEPEAAPSNTEEVTLERTKRQSNWEYYFYDPAHYRRPSRQQSSRSRTRTNSRVVDDYDYDQRQTTWDDFDYDADEEVVVVTKRPSSSTRTSSKQSSSSRVTTAKPRTRTSSSSSSKQSGVSRMRKPVPEELAGTSNKKTSSVTSRRGEISSNTRPRTKTSFPTTTERTTRRFGNTRKPSSRNRLPADDEEEISGNSLQSGGSAPLLSAPLQVTHKVPTEATIPVINNGVTEFKTVITASPSVELLTQYQTTKVSGTWRYYASEISSTPSPGVTVVTQFVLKPSETSTVTFTPTTIRGRPTSFSHLVPSTVYEVEPVVSTISDPVASTNSLLQQLLLGGLQQAGGVPVTSYSTHTTTYVTTLTEHKTTKIPITLRGQEIFTTIVGSSTSVLTVTEFSTQTIVTGATATEMAANPLVNLLPALLGNPLLAGQLLQPQVQPSQVLPIVPTQAPQLVVTLPPQEKDLEEFLEPEIEPEQQEEPVSVVIEPAKPVPQTSVITLFLSGRRPGEFSSILSTITLDGGSDSSVVKREASPSDAPEVLQVEASALPFMVGTEKGVYELPERYSSKDLHYYVMSAINEVGAETITDVRETQRLESIINKMKPKNGKVRKTRQVNGEDELAGNEEILEAVESNVDELAVDPSTGRQFLRSRNIATFPKSTSDERDVADEEFPAILSSLEENETNEPFRGDVYAPRTYYTVYSYFYTLLNGPSSGLVSSREVSISEMVRGSDGRIPSGFRRTENNNGLYQLSIGSSTADLSTRVSNGITTQVNLASMTLVKYGRGAIRASLPSGKQAEELGIGRPASGASRRQNIIPTPRVEPSFDSFEREVETAINPTQRLPSRGRSSASRQRQQLVGVETSKARSSSNRGRGTVRFNVASVLGDQLSDIPSSLAITTKRVSSSTVVRNRRPPIQQQLIEEEFEEEEEDLSKDFADDYYDDQDPHHEEEDLTIADEEVDYADDHEEEGLSGEEPKVEKDVVNVVKPVTLTTTPAKTITTPTKPVGVTPTRSTISRKLLNPLESHLSSILAHSRSSLKASISATSVTNEPDSSAPFRSSRVLSRTSGLTTSFQTSTVVLKTFETLSTLPVDGGRSGIPLTLITSTLTTLYDSELALLTLSPELFKPVVEPTQLPVSRPNWLNLNPTARLTLPIRASVAIGNSLLPSTGSIESTIEDTTTEFNTESSPIDTLLSLQGGSGADNSLKTVTVVETEMRTFTAVVTRKSGNEVEEVTTRLEVLPELVTKTIVQPATGTPDKKIKTKSLQVTVFFFLYNSSFSKSLILADLSSKRPETNFLCLSLMYCPVNLSVENGSFLLIFTEFFK